LVNREKCAKVELFTTRFLLWQGSRTRENEPSPRRKEAGGKNNSWGA